MNHNKPKLPIESRETLDYFARLQHNPEFIAARREIGGPREVGRTALQQIMALTASRINEQPQRYEAFDRDYNHLIALLPDLDLGLRRLDLEVGNRKDNLRKVIPFNHAVKDIINRQRLKEPRELNALVRNLAVRSGYGEDLPRNINRHIIPGMVHELALETNLYYLPEEPEIMDTTVEDELKGIDYKLRYDDGMEITLDVKRSEEAARKAREKREDWRRNRGITSTDSHIIIHTGYNDDKTSLDYDFVEGSIARVKDSAREREQPRIDTAITAKRKELLGTRVNT
jgi:hypothetical protein